MSEQMGGYAGEKMVLGYWHIRGLGQPIRFMLEYAGIPYDDVTYEVGDAPDFSADVWRKPKRANEWGLDFPNLPYLIHGNFKITQSNAILNYIAKLSGIFTYNVQEEARADMLLDQVMDLRTAYQRPTYTSGDYTRHEGFAKQRVFPVYDKMLAESNKWLCGPNIHPCDFHFYEMCFQHNVHFPDMFDEMPNIAAFIRRFENLPAIKAYLNSDRYKKLPFNNKSAKYGGTADY